MASSPSIGVDAWASSSSASWTTSSRVAPWPSLPFRPRSAPTRARTSSSTVSNSPSQCAVGLRAVSSRVWLCRRVVPKSSSLTRLGSENPCSGSWQDAHERVPERLTSGSKKSRRPSSIRASCLGRSLPAPLRVRPAWAAGVIWVRVRRATINAVVHVMSMVRNDEGALGMLVSNRFVRPIASPVPGPPACPADGVGVPLPGLCCRTGACAATSPFDRSATQG